MDMKALNRAGTAFLLAALAGCATERDQLEKEQTQLRQQREFLQNQLDQHPVGTRWATHPDTMKLLETQQGVDSRIREIDRRLQE
jgi:hypothetical protein